MTHAVNLPLHKIKLCSFTNFISQKVSDSKVIGTLSNDDDDGSENVAKKMNLRSFKLNDVYLDPLNISSAGDSSWS